MALLSEDKLTEMEIRPLKKIYDNCSNNEREVIDWIYEKVSSKFE